MRRNAIPVDDANKCEQCGHLVWRLTHGLWCPCEDCHPGGLVQGRGTKVVPITNVAPTSEGTADDVTWVDPMHTA